MTHQSAYVYGFTLRTHSCTASSDRGVRLMPTSTLPRTLGVKGWVLCRAVPCFVLVQSGLSAGNAQLAARRADFVCKNLC